MAFDLRRKPAKNLNAIDFFGSQAAPRIEMIEVSKIFPNEKNFYSVGDVEILAEDIERQGLNQNLVVAPKAESGGEYVIISGHRRYAAVCFLIGAGRYASKYLPCVVCDKPADELELDLIMDNATARVLTDGDVMEQYRRLREYFARKKADGVKLGRIRERIAEALRVSPAQVGKIENVEYNAVSEVKAAVENGEMSISAADRITRKNQKSNADRSGEKNVLLVAQNSDAVKNGVGKYSGYAAYFEIALRFFAVRKANFKGYAIADLGKTESEFDEIYGKIVGGLERIISESEEKCSTELL